MIFDIDLANSTTMRKIFFILFPIIALFWSSCGQKKENEELKAKLEQMEIEAENNQKVAEILNEVGSLMDSIDQNREVLRVDLETGTSYRDYKERMEDINEYIKSSENRISELERTLQEAVEANQAYAGSLTRIKRDLRAKTEEVARLTELVEQYRSENESLVSTVTLQQAQLNDLEGDIQVKKEELDLLEVRIEELMIQSQMDEADAYFARAAAVEEAAKRTRLAPKKKRQTLQEAIELYQKAYSLGRDDAKKKIDQLKKQ